jgi:O-antigen/teichoic acid export membrane protein
MSTVPRVASAIVDQALISGANFLVIVAIGRSATPADFALFTLAYTVTVFASGMHNGMVLQPLGMLLPERSASQRPGYLAGLVRLHTLALLPLLAAAAIAWTVSPHGLLVAWTMVATWCRLAHEHERRTAYALHDTGRALIIDAAAGVPMAVAAALIIVLRPHLGPSAGLVLLTAASVLGIITGRLLLGRERTAAPAPLAPLLREHWHVGRWLVAGSVMSLLADYLYPFLIAGYLGLEETALLAAARSVINAGNVAINGMDAYAGPRLRAIRVERGLPAMRSAALRFGGGLVAALLCICLPILVAPRMIMELAYGPHYANGAWILVAFTGIFLVRAVHKIFALVLLALKRPGSGFIAVSINALVTILAGPLLVREFGLHGAVAALAVNAVVILLVLAIGTVRAWRQDQGIRREEIMTEALPDAG